MTDQSQRPPLRQRLLAGIGGALVLAFIGGALFSEGGVTRHEKLRSELRELEALNAGLATDNARLEREVRALQVDKRYIEAEARDELGWVAPNDMVFIFSPSDASP